MTVQGFPVDKLKEICDRLRRNDPSLTKVDLVFQRVGDAAVTKLAQALKRNTKLKKLYVNFNVISSKGAAALAQVLKTQKSIVKVKIGNNELSAEGAYAFADMLRCNKHIQKLYMTNANIGEAGGAALLDTLEYYNSTLEEMALDHNKLSIGQMRQLHALLRRNVEAHKQRVPVSLPTPPSPPATADEWLNLPTILPSAPSSDCDCAGVMVVPVAPPSVEAVAVPPSLSATPPSSIASSRTTSPLPSVHHKNAPIRDQETAASKKMQASSPTTVSTVNLTPPTSLATPTSEVPGAIQIPEHGSIDSYHLTRALSSATADEEHLSLSRSLQDMGFTSLSKADEDASPLHAAINLDDMELLQEYVEDDEMDVNHVDSLGRTPADFAALQGKLDVCKFLKKHGGKYKYDNEARMRRIAREIAEAKK